MTPTEDPNGSPTLMRRINAGRILTELREGGPQSRAGLARATGLSKPAVNALVEDLVDQGYVAPTEQASATTGPGRPARLYTFRTDMGYVVGADIGANKLAVVLANLAGEVVASRRVETSTVASSGPEAVLRLLVATIEEVCAEVEIRAEQLKRAVIGTPGVVHPDGTVHTVPQLAGWEGYRLQAALTSAVGCPVEVEREVHLSLMAERWHGASQGLTNALYVQVGVGVGAGLLVNGDVVRGANGAAGEIGLMPLGDAPPQVGGNFGPFEWATGGMGLATRGRELAERPEGAALRTHVDGNLEAIDAAAVFEVASTGDTATTALVRDALGTLAQGISALVCALNPEAVIISGGLSRAGNALVEPLRAQVAEVVTYATRFLTSTLSDEAVALGAVRLGLDDVERTLLRQPSLT